MAIKRGIDKAIQSVRDSIADQSTPVFRKEQIANVAKLSSHDDEWEILLQM